MRILIVEDNPDISANLSAYLEPRGHVVDFATSGYRGLALAAENSYDAFVIDVGLPGLDGLALCRKIRTELHQSTPILMLTARDTVADKVAGFESGTDDYLVKPFSLVELELRINALVRRMRGGTATFMQVGDLEFNPGTYVARYRDRPLALTRFGYRLLACLMRASPNVVTRESLEAELWGDNRPDSDALRTHVHALRQAMEKAGAPAMLKTVQGVGYRLASE